MDTAKRTETTQKKGASVAEPWEEQCSWWLLWLCEGLSTIQVGGQAVTFR